MSASDPVYTIGHSTRPFDQLIQILQVFDIRFLVDVRTIPKSRRNPQYSQVELESHLPSRGIQYLHLKGLGGLRRAAGNSVNTGWRNISFRGYADYMQTGDFQQSLDKLVQVARNGRSAIMCAEAVPWRCHRSLIADSLVILNINVEHIISESSVRPHSLTPFARVDDMGRLTYPEELS